MNTEHNEILQRLSKSLYGDAMSLAVVDPRELVLLAKNARVLKKDTFQQLTKNILNDKRLSSVPLCWRMADGKLEVLSGNHRVQAAIQAGLAHVLVMVIEEDLSKAQQIAIQLSHNALVGNDDPTILAELWAAIDDIEAKLYAGLSSDEVERLEKIELVGFSTPQVCTRTMTFAFVDSEAERFNAVLEQLETLPAKEMHIADLDQFSRFFELLEGVKKSFDVRNSSLAMLKLMDIAEAALRERTVSGPISACDVTLYASALGAYLSGWSLPARERIDAAYRKTLYETLKASPMRFAMSTDMALLPLSSSDMRVWLIPRRSAISACVSSSLPRKPRKAIAGDALGNTSSMLYSSSPSALTRRTLCPAKANTPRTASVTRPSSLAGTVRHISAEEPVVCVFMTACINNLHDFYLLVNDFPHRHIAGFTAVQMAMVRVFFVYELPVVTPFGLFRAFIAQLKGEGKQPFHYCWRKLPGLFSRLGGEINRPQCRWSILRGVHDTNISILDILSTNGQATSPLTSAVFSGILNVPKLVGVSDAFTCPKLVKRTDLFVSATDTPRWGVVTYRQNNVRVSARPRRPTSAGERCSAFFCVQFPKLVRCFMSFSRFEPLGEGLAISILTPLMEYADTLAQTHDRAPQSVLLWVLINDAKQRLESIFETVNAVKPDILVELTDIQ